MSRYVDNTILPDRIPERFLGAEARLGRAQTVVISNHITSTWQEVNFPEDNQPEEHGKLFVHAGDGAAMTLQLCYLVYNDDSTDSAMACAISFMPAFFDQYPSDVLFAGPHFSRGKSNTLQLAVDAYSSSVIDKLRTEMPGMGFTSLLLQSQLAVALLHKAMESIVVPVTAEEVPACRFLAYDSEREKILDACAIIERSEGRPHTIRELSRKVAMNECYLKKGFKALTGKTIHEYQQQLRIDKARVMLQSQGISVTDVALTLGYSSISHFSTAFKRVTGMKPCELLA